MFVFGYSFVREENVIIQTDYQAFGITHFDSAVCITIADSKKYCSERIIAQNHFISEVSLSKAFALLYGITTVGIPAA